MRINNKGFAISSIMYLILVLALILMVTTLALLSSRKLILDKMKKEVSSSINNEKYKRYYNGEVVYFDVDTGGICSNYTESQSNTGVKSGCMKFYAFNDFGNDTVNLILDHNISSGMIWNSDPNSTIGPNDVLNQLKTDTSSWKGTNTPANYPIILTTTSKEKINTTVDYTGYKARLITAKEIAQIVGYRSFNEVTSTKFYYLDSKTSTPSSTCKYDSSTKTSVTTGCNYGWLNDRTGTSCKNYGCLNNSDVATTGYWTATPSPNYSGNAWNLEQSAYMDTPVILAASGVRPVIEVSKSRLVTKTICKAVKEATTGSVPKGNYTLGDEYTCDVGDSYTNTFFVLENKGDTVSLIMKENFVDSYVSKTIRWCTDGTNNNTTCKNITSKGSSAPTGADYLGHIEGIFNNPGVKVSFPSANQIANVAGKTFNYQTLSGIFPVWLYDYAARATNQVSGVWGYLTTTPDISTSNNVWAVSDSNALTTIGTYDSITLGLRPVITISKYKMS